MNETRKCKTCAESKPLSEFYSFLSEGKWTCYGSSCKSCANSNSRKRRWIDIEKTRATERQRGAKQLKKHCIDCGIARTELVPWGIESLNTDKYGRKSLCLKCFDARKQRTKENIVRLKKLSDMRCSERINRANRAWRSKNLQHYRKYQRVWAQKKRAQNPELERQKQRDWASKNRHKKAATFKKWATKNPDKMLHKNRVRRALQRGAVTPESALVTREWFDSLCASQGHRCYYCWSTDKKLSADHITPLVQGGKHVQSNLIPACKSCNSSKKNRRISEWRPWIDIPLYGLDLASA